ncbi:MAG: hypothetical protein J2P57_14250 [Acidimicrobiaceae bacterium]|nr:hypothetical protein [Acidimicrobiaceae bacterium]
MGDPQITPGQYEQELAAAIDNLQSLAGDFSQVANDLQLVQQRLSFNVTGIDRIAGADALAPMDQTSPGQDFMYGRGASGGYYDCTQGQLANLGKLISGLGQMADGLNTSAQQLQQRENEAVQTFGNLLPPPPAAPPGERRRPPRWAP